MSHELRTPLAAIMRLQRAVRAGDLGRADQREWAASDPEGGHATCSDARRRGSRHRPHRGGRAVDLGRAGRGRPAARRRDRAGRAAGGASSGHAPRRRDPGPAAATRSADTQRLKQVMMNLLVERGQVQPPRAARCTSRSRASARTGCGWRSPTPARGSTGTRCASSSSRSSGSTPGAGRRGHRPRPRALAKPGRGDGRHAERARARRARAARFTVELARRRARRGGRRGGGGRRAGRPAPVRRRAPRPLHRGHRGQHPPGRGDPRSRARASSCWPRCRGARPRARGASTARTWSCSTCTCPTSTATRCSRRLRADERTQGHPGRRPQRRRHRPHSGPLLEAGRSGLPDQADRGARAARGGRHLRRWLSQVRTRSAG